MSIDARNRLMGQHGRRKLPLYFCFALALALLMPFGVALAQEEIPEGPVYIVQEGDSLWNIAVRFGVSLQALQDANGLSDPGQLSLGAQLVIPGLDGVQGVLTTETVPFGESLTSLSRRYNLSEALLARLNRLTSPSELFAGVSLIIPAENENAQIFQRMSLDEGQSPLELAVLQDINPWRLATTNGLENPWRAIPGDVMQVSSAGEAPGDAPQAPGALPGNIHSLQLRPQFLNQGGTAVISIQGEPGMEIEGSLAGTDLLFFPYENGYIGLQGIHAMQEPRLYPLVLKGMRSDGSPFAFQQTVYVRPGDYPFDPVLNVSPETIDPSVTKPEDAEWKALAANVTSEKLWKGQFESPMAPPFSDCYPSRFGNRRSYNGSAYDYYHTGLDFCGGVGTEIRAPAAGRVVFAGPMAVRGNATMIDHGFGVFSGYMHQSEIFVKAGELVQPGQLIGLVGGTGRVTGPHLHWEIFVGGIQVDPLDWLEQEYP